MSRTKKCKNGKKRITNQSERRHRDAKDIACWVFPDQFASLVKADDIGFSEKTLEDVNSDNDTNFN